MNSGITRRSPDAFAVEQHADVPEHGGAAPRSSASHAMRRGTRPDLYDEVAEYQPVSEGDDHSGAEAGTSSP